MPTATLTRAALLGVALLAPLAANAQSQCGSAVRVTDDISADVTWSASSEYCLDGLIFVNDGATLTIEPGTVVRGVRDDRITTGDGASALVIRRGGMIMADGTAADPIIFTAEDDDLSDPTDFLQRERGEWAGIIVLGKASNNQPTTDNQIEGIEYDPVNQTGDEALYGGTEDDDNSGVLRYVSVRHSGFSITGVEGDEIQGITLGGVGSGTTIEYVEIFASNDDGIEWFGGTVNVKYAVVAFPFDDAFDYDQGWRGKGQFWFTIADTDAAGRGGEHDGGDDGGDDATPYATPVISNATYIGSGGTSPADGDGNDYAFRMRDGAGGYYFNSVFTDFPDRAIDIENFEAGATFDSYQQYVDGRLKIENNLFHSFGRGTTFDDITDASYSDSSPSTPGTADDDAFAAYISGANTLGTESPVLSVSRTDDNGLDPRPSATGGAVTGADFSATELDDFFDEVDYLGAFAPGAAAWIAGWTALDQTGFLSDNVNVANEEEVAARFELTVGPNPVRSSAAVAFSLDRAQDVRLSLYDALGRQVATLVEGSLPAGPASGRLDASSLPAGVYVLRLQAEDATLTHTLTVVR
ncbi:MAG: T9SS type A sorting domain-containing protein [Bacteroidota bacterium]